MPYIPRLATALSMSCVSAALAPAQNQQWVRQVGSSDGDVTNSAAPAPASGVFITGSTHGALAGATAGGLDAWLARYDSAGAQVWIRQVGTSGYDSALACAADGAGGFYAGGFTDSDLGGTSAGGSDAWFARYDGAGGQSWLRQLGTDAADTAWALARDGAGGLFV